MHALCRTLLLGVSGSIAAAAIPGYILFLRRGLVEHVRVILTDSAAQIVTPATMQDAPDYDDVVGEVHRFLTERMFACQLAGIDKVPAIVRDLDDQSALAVALIENLQREDLNPIDQARSMLRLVEEFDLTHDEIAKALGRSRASISASKASFRYMPPM